MIKNEQIMIFRACARAILELDLTPEGADAAAKSFRQGDLGYQIASLLEGLALGASSQDRSTRRQPPIGSQNVQVPERKSDNAVSALKVFDDVKRRKIAKAHLQSMFHQISPEAADKINDAYSVRESIELFKELVDKENWSLLADIVSGNFKFDPFLAKMSEK